MATNVTAQPHSPPVSDFDEVRPAMAKAGLRGTEADQKVSAVIALAVEQHYGSIKAAAISLRIDRSQMQREFAAGKFACLERADSEAKGAIADAVYRAFGTVTKPKQAAQRTIRDIRHRLDMLAEYVEFIG